MNCWKSVNLIRHYGGQRLFILSAISGLLFFMTAYSLYQLIFPSLRSTELGPSLLFIAVIFVLPVHKIFHCIPLWLLGKKAKLILKQKGIGLLPMIFCRLPETLSKKVTIAVVIFPFFMLTGLCLASAILLPKLMMVSLTFASVNVGLSFVDLLYFSWLLKAPKWAMIEDYTDGFFILVQE